MQLRRGRMWTGRRRAGTQSGMGEFFRQATWLNPPRVRGYLRLFALANVATLLFLVLTARTGVDRNGFLLGTDFLSFWTAARMLAEHGNVYDVAAHSAAQLAFFAQKGAHAAFFYPPMFLPFCFPFGLLPYFPALGAWLLVTGTAWVAAVRLWLRRFGIGFSPVVLCAAFPPVLITITHGQTSFLLSALLGTGALLVRERPWLAGAMFGLAVMKPQFGLLVPIVLLLTGEWRVIAGAVGGALALALVSTLAFGPQVWADWLAIGTAARDAMGDGSIGHAKMTSVFAGALLLGAPSDVATALQAACSLAVAGALAWTCRGRRYTPALGAAMLAGAPLATPFVLDYDMVLMAFPLAYLASQPFRAWEKFVTAAVFVAPAFARPLAVSAGIPIMPPVLAALFVLLVLRIRADLPPPGAPGGSDL